MKALVLNGKVIDVSEKEFEVHSSCTWVDCDDKVALGWTYDGKSFKTNEIVSLISELDEEFKKGNTIYPNDPLAAPLEITMIWALRHFYPCGDE